MTIGEKMVWAAAYFAEWRRLILEGMPDDKASESAACIAQMAVSSMIFAWHSTIKGGPKFMVQEMLK